MSEKTCSAAGCDERALNENNVDAYVARGYNRNERVGAFDLSLRDGVSPVPEPETYGMMLAGLALIAAVRRKAAKAG